MSEKKLTPLKKIDAVDQRLANIGYIMAKVSADAQACYSRSVAANSVSEVSGLDLFKVFQVCIKSRGFAPLLFLFL